MPHPQAKAWSRFFCHSVYVTMYLNDHSRASFYESLGLNTTQFNRYIRHILMRLAVVTICLLHRWLGHHLFVPQKMTLLKAGFLVPVQARHHRDQQHHSAHLPLSARLRDARVLVRPPLSCCPAAFVYAAILCQSSR